VVEFTSAKVQNMPVKCAINAPKMRLDVVVVALYYLLQYVVSTGL